MTCNCPPITIFPAIDNLLDDRERRESISKKGRELVDGRGRERVLKSSTKVSKDN